MDSSSDESEFPTAGTVEHEPLANTWNGSLSRQVFIDDIKEHEKRKRVHRLSGVAHARFSQHYEDHGTLLKTEPPAPTFKKSLRYSREAHKKICHWKPKKEGKDMADRGSQVALKGPSTSKYAFNSSTTREMPVQTAHVVEVKPDVSNFGQQVEIMEQSSNIPIDEILALLRGLKTDCPGAHVPQGLMEEMSTALVDLSGLLKIVDGKADGIDTKDKDILHYVKKFKPTPCGGPHIPEQTIQNIVSLLHEIAEFLRNFQKDDYSQLIEFINIRMTRLNDFLMELRKEHNDIFRAIQNLSGQKCEGPHIPESYIREMHMYMQEILTLMKTEKVMTTYMEPSPVFIMQKVCSCEELVKRANNDAKFAQQSFLTGMCQKCVNDYQGREFIRHLGMPDSMTHELLNIVGNIVQAIMDDNSDRTKYLITLFKQQTPTWQPEEYQKCLEALLHLALIWDRQISAQYLASIVDVPAMFMKISENRRVYNLSDFIQSAAEAQNPEVLICLLRGLSPRDKIVVINSPAIYKERKVLSLFEAARRGDVKCFEILVEHGAELDILENGHSILHELARLSAEKRTVAAADAWEVCITNMLDAVYNLAGVWWERTHGRYEKADDTIAGRKSALRYLFQHVKDKDGRTALEYAAIKGMPYLIKKIVNSPPYAFFPDPFGAGYYNGMIGYVTGHIDSACVDKGFSVIELMAQRKQEAAGAVLSLEPFRSLVNDKWNRYKPFFFLSCIAYLCYMCIFTACAMTRPTPPEHTWDEMYNTSRDYARLAGEIICLIFLPFFFYGEIRNIIRGRWRFAKPWDWFGLFRFLNIVFVILVIAILVLRCLDDINEDIVWSLALLVGWCNGLQFLAAWRRYGIFQVIMRKVFVRDLLIRFLPTYFILLLAISTATFVMYQYTGYIVPEYSNSTYLMTPFTLFTMTFALQDAEHISEARDPGTGYFLFLVHLIVGILIPFIMFAALVFDTYSRSRKSVKENWMWVRANFAMYIENRLPKPFLIQYQSRSNHKRLLHANTLFGDTTLKYVMKIERLRQMDGKVVEHEECSVLVRREDPPIPEASLATKEACRRLLSMEKIRAPPPRPAPLSSLPSKPNKLAFENPLTITDLGNTGDSFGLATYESLDSAASVVRLGRNKVGNGRTTPM